MLRLVAESVCACCRLSACMSDCHRLIDKASKWQYREKVLCGLVVRAQIDAADAEIVAGADKAGAELKRTPICVQGLEAAVAVGQRGAQLVPQQAILWSAPHDQKRRCGLYAST